MDSKKLNIAIVDDHEIFRNGLKMVLSKLKIINNIYEAEDGIDFISKLKTNKIDIVLMDIEMPRMNGIEATKEALKIQPSLQVIALSMFQDDEYIQSMIDAGVKGFLIKNINKEILCKAISSVSEGKVYYSEELWEFFTKKMNALQNASPSINFTKREIEILELLYDGMTNKEIADKLFISERTVIGHKSNLLSKTGCKNAIGLISYALKNKIIEI
ncbi:MAG: DNA-binding response regulator [Bacteroidetes bacterium]|nr:MAG: DNA-binding response regulator [Bacteroidota bacterium]